jgi:DNA polymerase-3 subunit beta
VKFTIAAGVLANALALAALRTDRKKPAHGAVRIVVGDDDLSLTCADAYTSIIGTVPANVVESGHVAVAADRLAALSAGFAAGAMMTVTAEPSAAVVVAGNSRSRLAIIPWTDLPDVPAITDDDETGRIEIDTADCLRLFEPLAAASTEPTRKFLCGMFMHNDATCGQLIAVGTDGVQLIRVAIVAGKFSQDRTAILPTQASALLQRLIKGAKPKRIMLRRSLSSLGVIGTGFEFTTRMIEGPYPEYERLIPEASSDAVTVDRAELLAALARLGAVATTVDTPLVALVWNAGALNLSLARQPDDGVDRLVADGSGAAKVALPLTQFSALINQIPGDRIRLDCTEGRPLIVMGTGNKLAILARSAWNFYR